MLKTAGLLALSALLSATPGMSQVQPGIGAHLLLAAATSGERELPHTNPRDGKSEVNKPEPIALPLLLDPNAKWKIGKGWHSGPYNGIPSNFCKNNAVAACTAQCADVGACVFGCEIGGINNVDTCNSSCSGLGDTCLNACYSTSDAINACPWLQLMSVNLLFGSGSSYTLSATSPTILPWQVTGIQLVFTQIVATGSIHSLGGVTATSFTGLGTNTLTWTIPPTPIANITLTVATSGVNLISDASGNKLEDGAPTSKLLKILAGDVNGDGVVNASDLVLANGAIAKPYNILYDTNGDGSVSAADVTAVKARLNTKLPTQP